MVINNREVSILTEQPSNQNIRQLALAVWIANGSSVNAFNPRLFHAVFIQNKMC